MMNYLKREDFLAVDMDGVRKVRERDFDVTDLCNLKTVPMLYQAGYLTIDKYDGNTGRKTGIRKRCRGPFCGMPVLFRRGSYDGQDKTAVC